MDDYIGSIKIFAGKYAPLDWAFCNGALMSVRQYTALYSLLGTQFGGDGQNTFALPNLNSRLMIGPGMMNGIGNISQGMHVGDEAVTLNYSQMAAHTHAFQAINAIGTVNTPVGTPTKGNVPAQYSFGTGRSVDPLNWFSDSANAILYPSAVDNIGGSADHNNIQPVLAISFIICVNGNYPPFS